MLLQKSFLRLKIALFVFLCIQIKSTLTSNVINEKDNHTLRLPNNTSPTKYYLHITTHIHQDILEFTGNVTIDLTVFEATTEIVLHAKNLRDFKVHLIDLKNNNLIENLRHLTEYTKDFLRIYSPIELKVGQDYRLVILFEGNIRQQHFGFYRTTYLDELNNPIPIASTQFEPTSARLAFPCYDEPAFKARFIISITHGSNYTALSNMPVEGKPTQSSDGQMTTTSFQQTPIMSTYLIAFVVSNYEHVSEVFNGIEHRVFFPPNSKSIGKKALDNAISTVTALENYLGIKYPLPKLDHFPVDKTYGLAMENWGIITYNKRNLISGVEKIISRPLIKMIVVQNHEIAHQWFGNLVSPKWWTYAWLNEGFATYFAYVSAQLVHPGWNIDEVFIQNEVDIIKNWAATHAITQYVEEESDIKSTFDAVCYQKSAGIIKMFHHAIGLKTFIKGVASFLTKFKYSVADEEDLFGVLQNVIDSEDQNIFKNSERISSIIHTWTHNKGIPMVTVIRNYDEGTITFRQRSNSKHFNEKWWIPLNFATASNPNFDQTVPDFILPPKKELTVDLSVLNLNISNDDWLIVNKQQTGIFFVNYDDRNLGLIAEALNNDYEKIHVNNRALLFQDIKEFIDKEFGEINTLLLALQYLKHEQQLMPWYTAADLIMDLISKLNGSTTLEMFKSFIRDIIADTFHRVYRTPDTRIEFKAVGKIIELACTVDLPECLEYTKILANDHFFNGHEIKSDLRDIAMCQGIKYYSAEELKHLLEKLVAANANSPYYDDVVYTIRCIELPESIKLFLNFMLGENSTFVSMGEFEKMQYVSFLYKTNFISRPIIMTYFRDNFKTLFKNVSMAAYALQRISSFVPEDDGQKDEFLTLLTSTTPYDLLSSTIEDLEIGSRLKQNKEFLSKYEKNMRKWFSERERTTKNVESSTSKLSPSLIAAKYIFTAGFVSSLVNFV